MAGIFVDFFWLSKKYKIKGIYRDKTMADKLMNIPNDDKQNHPSEDYNYWLERFDTQVNESTNQNSLKSPKLFSQRIE